MALLLERYHLTKTKQHCILCMKRICIVIVMFVCVLNILSNSYHRKGLYVQFTVIRQLHGVLIYIRKLQSYAH